MNDPSDGIEHAAARAPRTSLRFIEFAEQFREVD